MAIEQLGPVSGRWSVLRDAMKHAPGKRVSCGRETNGGAGGAFSLPVDISETEKRVCGPCISAGGQAGRPPAHGSAVIPWTIRGETKAEEEKKGHTWHVPRSARSGSFPAFP